MPSSNERIGSLVQQGILLFSRAVPFPASTLIAAIAAGVLTKILEQHEARVSEVLSIDLSASHIPYVHPDESEMLAFYQENFLFPELKTEFAPELNTGNVETLRRFYPFLYSALVLQRQLPSILFHQEISQKQYRDLAIQYEQLSRGYTTIEGNTEIQSNINHFAGELLEVLSAVYEAIKKEKKIKENQIIFDLMDSILEIIKR